MDSSESQNEEREVLQSIYEGDPNFKEINPACYQYKYGGEENEQKAFLVEISWPKDYPEVLPVINLDLFLNNTLPKSLKEKIKSDILQQAEDLLGTPMTYSLLDWTRENAQDIIQRIPENLQKESAFEVNLESQEATDKPKKEKKEQLTKAQKRKITNRTDFKGERERGWDWVDVVKHLCQTGHQAQQQQQK